MRLWRCLLLACDVDSNRRDTVEPSVGCSAEYLSLPGHAQHIDQRSSRPAELMRWNGTVASRLVMHGVYRHQLQAQARETLEVAIESAKERAMFDGNGGKVCIGGEVAGVAGTDQ
jgi:hypothetical protein